MDFHRCLLTLAALLAFIFISHASSAQSASSNGLQICSTLDFSGVQWPADVPAEYHDPFALGLNISGSFEGPDGWSNLTNNFDGQGISMGLLNQNLGQGSLQPLWIQMTQTGLPDLKVIFTAAHLNSVLGMLKTWQEAGGPHVLDLRAHGYSELDDPQMIAQQMGLKPEVVALMTANLIARNQASVNWAKSTVLNGINIRPDWSAELKHFSVAAPYRSIQLDAAENLHEESLQLLQTYHFTSWRAYLFFFDIVVQDGGIPASVQTQYFDWLKKNPKASETTRLVQLLTYRLQLVKKQYQADVKSRKMAIINGSGVVHGQRRNFEKEYCYQGEHSI